jgi:ribosomal protein L20A (L18A)
MLIRTRLLRACQVFLISGLSLSALQAISAQSVGSTPSQASEVTPAQSPQQASPQAPPEPVVKLADVVKRVETEGLATSIPNYIAEDIGIKITSSDSSPVLARAMSDSRRELYLIDDTGDLLFLMKDDNTTAAYLANRAGVLQTAGYFYPGRFHSQEFKSSSKEKAAAGFAAEKQSWIKKLFPSKYADAVKPEESVSKSNQVKSEAAPVARNTAAKTSATTTAKASAEAKEKDLSQMTPKERVKYLDQQIREVKREEKLEKKERAKEKKLAGKSAAAKPQETKDDKSAEKTPQAAPANSSQQSNSDSDATPPKKKISWF